MDVCALADLTYQQISIAFWKSSWKSLEEEEDT